MLADVAAFDIVNHIKQQRCGIIEEPVTVHATVLLTVKVYSFFEARCQPGADGLCVIIPAVHGYDA